MRMTMEWWVVKERMMKFTPELYVDFTGPLDDLKTCQLELIECEKRYKNDKFKCIERIIIESDC